VHESILAFRKRRYLWVAIIVSLLAIAAYVLDDPQEPPNGGTVLGYTLGTIGTLLILWLTWFGIRKRRYSSTRGTVQGWLSAHVYLGVALLIIVLLHAGFQFGVNVHTVAFVFMALVIASGLWGVLIYMKYPERASANRDGSSRPELMDQLEELDRRAQRIAGDLNDDFRELVESGVARTQLGSTLWARLRGRDLSQVVLRSGGQTNVVANPGQEAALDWLANEQSQATDADSLAKIGELSALIRNKRQLLRQITDDLRLQATMEIWLYFHVPLTAGLLMALAAHIITVFLYW
jgi:hypothetical protein